MKLIREEIVSVGKRRLYFKLIIDSDTAKYLLTTQVTFAIILRFICFDFLNASLSIIGVGVFR